MAGCPRFRELGILSQIGELTGAAADRLRGHGGEPLTGRRVARRTTGGEHLPGDGGEPLAGWGESERLTTGR